MNIPLLSTHLEWTDLALSEESLGQLEEIGEWLRHRDSISEKHAWANQNKSGYLALFAGLNSEIKVHVAALMGRERRWPVYRVDLRITVVRGNLFGKVQRRLFWSY